MFATLLWRKHYHSLEVNLVTNIAGIMILSTMVIFKRQFASQEATLSMPASYHQHRPKERSSYRYHGGSHTHEVHTGTTFKRWHDLRSISFLTFT
jgi:hypothetical protein